MSKLMIALTVALVAVAPAVAKTTLPGFRSPSGNIKCLFVPAGRDDAGHRLSSRLVCSIGRATYANTLQARCLGPTGAGVDWHGWSLSPTGKGSVVCSGGVLYNPDTQRPSYLTLQYGGTWRQGAFTCSSRVTGVTCRNRNGHGLFISSLTWRAW